MAFHRQYPSSLEGMRGKNEMVAFNVVQFMEQTKLLLQIDRQMKGQSEIAYLPKFANIMLIAMVMVINEIF